LGKNSQYLDVFALRIPTLQSKLWQKFSILLLRFLIFQRFLNMASKSNGEITHLSSSTIIEGDIELDNDIRIAGSVVGKINARGALIVEQTGKIKGEIKASSATIAGKIQGNIECDGLMTLESSSSFVGNIKTRQIVINENAEFQGNCAMPVKSDNDIE
jgi:cytoskeletal protein CcmA (bactofilin family)